jgi:hypothetical protein
MKPENASGLFVPEAPGGPAAVEADEREGYRERDERRGSRTELLATLERLERTLDEVRGGLDARVRQERHREFSLAWAVGAVVQVLVVGLELWALSDWVFGEYGQILYKLSFAGVLQVGALTAFLMGRPAERV